MRSCLQIPAASFFVCFLAFTANAAAQAVYLFSFESGTGDWGNPAGIEVDGQSNIYVTDYGASEGADAVEVFDTGGNFQYSFGPVGTGLGQLNAAAGIALDATGMIYVVDRGNDRVQLFDSAGRYQSAIGSSGTEPGQFDSPTGIVLDHSGNILVTDSSNDRVQVFDSSGGYQLAFGSHGDSVGQFDFPRFSTVDDTGNIYVADSNNDRVQVFDSRGDYVFHFGSTGSGAGMFAIPLGITLDDDGNIYVADSNNNRVQVFDPSGSFQYEFGEVGQMDQPAGIAVADGRVYVANQSGYVSVFRLGFDSSPADFNGDGLIDCRDVDILTSEIAGGYNGSHFDLTDDGLVNGGDLDHWLLLGGAANLPSANPYLPGDANLDGVVDVSDFNLWNSHRLSQTAAWCSGDFNADGVVDVSDFNVWNSHRLMSSDGAVVVPEPKAPWMFFLILGFFAIEIRRPNSIPS